MLTKAGGKLNVKYVLHCVAPQCSKIQGVKNNQNLTEEEKSEQEERIQQENNTKIKSYESTIINILQSAKFIGAQSLSIPAVSCGLFGFPLEKGAKIIL